MLQIYNSLTNRKEPFQPIQAGSIRIYVCGMTVYDYCHIGHARVLVIFDSIVRYLRARGFDVTYVRNITDIDDKIIQRAADNDESVADLTARYIRAMHEDCEALRVAAPDVEPRATDSIQAIIGLIATLVNKGHAYTAANGDVYYDVSRFADYGKLSGRERSELRAGERVEVSEAKDDPLDFVLWKAAKPDEPAWDSPWGVGRPGWHIECSAMSTQWLGNHFDIHGGGLDLKFPHHENEIAQSEAATAAPFVNYWMHNGFVRIDEAKMSKSLGNFFTAREVFKQYRPEEVRFFILGSHYRSPLNYSDEQLANARQGLTRLYTALRGLPAAEAIGRSFYEARFFEAMDDDFNTAGALAVLFDLARDINKARQTDIDQAAGLGATLRQLAGGLGLLDGDPEDYLRAGTGEDAPTSEEIESLIEARRAARGRKHWGEADRIRDGLLARGVVLEDSSIGTTWRRESS